ncbi:MAG: hypothetical protein ACRDBP_02375 [Luteolibacter sp.]
MKIIATATFALLFTASVNAALITITFDEGNLPEGTIITNQYASLGLTQVIADGGTDDAILFDTEEKQWLNGTNKADRDLVRGGVTNGIWAGGGNLPNNTVLNNLLITQDSDRTAKNPDGTYKFPDDEVGSTITMLFSSAINSFGFDFADIESSESLRVNFFSGADSVGMFNVAALSTGEDFGNNSINTTNLKDLSGLGVNRVRFIFSGSGGIDNIRYDMNRKVPDGGASLALLGVSLLGLGGIRRFCK